MDYLNRAREWVTPYWEQVDKEAFNNWGTAAAGATGILVGIKIVSNIYLPEIIIDAATCAEIIILARLVQYVSAPVFDHFVETYKEQKALLDGASLIAPALIAILSTKALFQVKTWISFSLLGFTISFAVHDLVKPYIFIGGEAKAP